MIFRAVANAEEPHMTRRAMSIRLSPKRRPTQANQNARFWTAQPPGRLSSLSKTCHFSVVRP